MIPFLVAAVVAALLTLGYVFRPLSGSRGAVGIALVAIGLASTAGLYLLIGTPDALDPARREPPRTLESAIVRLEQELRRDPKQAEGWRLLAEAYRTTGRAVDAATALARAVELQPNDPELLVQAAEARAQAAPGRRLDPQAVALLQRALAMDPAHQRAAWFLGIAQRQAGRPADAARIWEALLPRVDPGTATALRTQIDAARSDAGLPPLTEAPANEASPAAIRVAVDIAPEVRARLPAGTPVFVLARVPGGPPMPVAVERITVGDLPATVELDDVDGPMPTRRLSDVGRVEVIARASASGTANAGAGDVESAPVTAVPGSRIDVRIERVRR